MSLTFSVHNSYHIYTGRSKHAKETDMTTQEAIAFRIRELCEERKITPIGLSYIAGVPQATLKSILGGESKNPGVVTIKKLCDGLGISLSDFFETKNFRELEQEPD